MSKIVYEYLTKEQMLASQNQFKNIVDELHHDLREQTGITFIDKLIGSASRKFILKEKGTQNFDYDYNLVVQNDAGYTNANALHGAFESSLAKLRDKYNMSHTSNPMQITKSKSVFTISFHDHASQYTCDLAIIDE